MRGRASTQPAPPPTHTSTPAAAPAPVPAAQPAATAVQQSLPASGEALAAALKTAAELKIQLERQQVTHAAEERRLQDEVERLSRGDGPASAKDAVIETQAHTIAQQKTYALMCTYSCT